jgi:hypothetical protein
MPALAVPVSECFVTLGSFDGAYPMIAESPENFGLERTSGGPRFEPVSDKTNIFLRLNKQKEVLEIARYNQEGEVVQFMRAPDDPIQVSVQLSEDCKDDSYNAVDLVCKNDLKKIKAATKQLLEQMPLSEACARARHREVTFTSAEMIRDIRATYLSAADAQDTAEEYCQMKGYENAVGLTTSKLQHRSAFGSFTASTIRMKLSPKEIRKMNSFEYQPSPDWGVDVFTRIPCQRGARAEEAAPSPNVVDTNEKSEPAGPSAPASGGSGAARAE